MMGADWPLWVSLPAGILLVLGGLLTLIGSAGLLRLRDFYSRMHPPTMGTTLGAGCVLLASMLVSYGLLGRPALHELLIAALLVLTAPLSSILLMRAARQRRRT